ncbi:MAG: adaptor protein MecA [Lachnospira sp.]|nr:adaptor protein MecA [Lachnospira sp.]
MKIEKISDMQIRCTLDREDLAARQLKLSELAYGTPKAKELFREMMQQASYQFGFEADDMPLMVEAIPIAQDHIILVITKVQDPDELDTRFSKVAPSMELDEEEEDDEDGMEEDDDDIYSRFRKVQEKLDDVNLGTVMEALTDVLQQTGASLVQDSKDDAGKGEKSVPGKKNGNVENAEAPKGTQAAGKRQEEQNLRVYRFSSLDNLIRAAKQMHCQDFYESQVYKDVKEGEYYLLMSQENPATEDFQRLCNVAVEFGERVRASFASKNYYKEHYETLVKENAIDFLAQL